MTDSTRKLKFKNRSRLLILIYMKRGHPEEAEEDNTPFFHHPRASVFDEEEADDVAYKFFNQEHERGKKKDASILSQLELEESDETSQQENDHKYVPVP